MHPIDFIIEQEGGFVNDPKDPGGATKYGISLRFLKTIDPIFADLDQDGDVDSDDIFGMTENQARYFYMKYFYGPMDIDEYVPVIGAILLDTGVNMGKKRAVKILQRALNSIGYHLVVDGIAGPVTRGTVKKADPGILIPSYLLGRVHKYCHLCKKYPDLRRFLLGWINRVRLLEHFALRLEREVA